MSTSKSSSNSAQPGTLWAARSRYRLHLGWTWSCRRLNHPPSTSSWLSHYASTTIKQWGIYAVVLLLPGSKPKLYIGSGTNSASAVETRCRSYINESGSLPYLLKKALQDGYEIASVGMLCWTDFPAPHLLPRSRARILVLEAIFTIFFYACHKMIMDDLFIPEFFLWQRQDVTWGALCTHLSISESVRADLSLTDEELSLAAAARAQRGVQKTRRCRLRQREKDESAFLQRGLDQHNDWSARNPGRIDEIAAGVRKRAKESACFRCDPCDFNAATQHALDSHCETRLHADTVRNGAKVVKEPSEAALAKRASRAAAKSDKSLYCSDCEKQFTSANALKRHNNTQKHQKKLKRQRDAAGPP